MRKSVLQLFEDGGRKKGGGVDEGEGESERSEERSEGMDGNRKDVGVRGTNKEMKRGTNTEVRARSRSYKREMDGTSYRNRSTRTAHQDECAQERRNSRLGPGVTKEVRKVSNVRDRTRPIRIGRGQDAGRSGKIRGR